MPQPSQSPRPAPTFGVDLLWIPLGTDTEVVRRSGLVFEAISAALRHRPRCTLYHSALALTLPGGRHVVEMTPVPDQHGADRGVVAEGAVGLRQAGRFRLFRYEIRRWRDGVIPDAHAATTVRVCDDAAVAQRIFDLVPLVPTPVWGRDELGTGEMWNSNSVVSWLLWEAGVDVASVHPPANGRAPGWDGGVTMAVRPPGPSVAAPA